MRAVLIAVVLLGAGAAAAQPVDHEALGYQLAADGKLEEALLEFQAAYQSKPEPQLLFAMGRIHALRGDCVRANDHFQRFLATQPGPKAVDAANAEIDKCKAAPIAIAPDPEPEPEVRPPPPPPARPSHRTSFGSALVHDRFAQLGGVSALVAGGLVVYGLSLACWDGVCEGDYDDFEAKRARAPKVAVAAGVFGAAAGALIITGVVRALQRPDDDAGFDVSLAPLDGGGAVAVGGAF